MYIRKTNDPLGRGQFWPQCYNLNNFCRGPLDNVSCQISKLKPLWFRRRRFFKFFSFSCRNWILWTTLKELDARNIHTKFYQIWPSGLGEVILMKKFTDGRTDGRTDDGNHGITIAHYEHYVLRWAKIIKGQ